MKLGLIYTAANVRLQYPSAQHDGKDTLSLVLSRQPPGAATLGTQTALPTDASTETRLEALRL